MKIINSNIEVRRYGRKGFERCVEIQQISDNGYKEDTIFLTPKEIKQVAKALITFIK